MRMRGVRAKNQKKAREVVCYSMEFGARLLDLMIPPSVECEMDLNHQTIYTLSSTPAYGYSKPCYLGQLPKMSIQAATKLSSISQNANESSVEPTSVEECSSRI